MRLHRRRWRLLASCPAQTLLLLLCLLWSPPVTFGCCGRSGAGPGSASGTRKNTPRCSQSSRRLNVRSIEEAFSETGIRSEDQLWLQEEAENMLRMHAEALHLLSHHHHSVAQAAQEGERANEQGNKQENKQATKEDMDILERSGWRQVMDDYRRKISGLDARLRRVEQTHSHEGLTVGAEAGAGECASASLFACKRVQKAAESWALEYDWEREDGDGEWASRETDRSSPVEADKIETGELDTILREAQKNGLTSLSYEQLLVLHEAVAKAASHTSLENRPLGGDGGGEGEGEGEGEDAEAEADADDDEEEEEGDEEGEGEDDLLSGRGFMVGAEAPTVEHYEGEAASSEAMEEEEEIGSVLTEETLGDGGDDVGKDETEGEGDEEAEDEGEDEGGDEGEGESGDEGEDEGEDEREDVDDAEDEYEGEAFARRAKEEPVKLKEDFGSGETGSEAPSSPHSASSYSESLSAPLDARAAPAHCSLCPADPPFDSRLEVAPSAERLAFDAGEDAVCAAQDDLATVSSSFSYPVDRLSRTAQDGLGIVGNYLHAVNLGQSDELNERCPLEGRVHQQMLPPQPSTTKGKTVSQASSNIEEPIPKD